MTDNLAHGMDLNGVQDAAPQGHKPASPWADADEDQALLQTLHQAVAQRYPVPNADEAWQRVMESRARLASPVIARMEVPEDLPKMLPVTTPPKDLGPNLPSAPVPQSWRSRWRSIAAVVALAVVMVPGLLGSMRGLVAWPPSLSQPSDSGATLQVVSAEQQILALDPGVILARLGSGWSVQSSWAGVADVEAVEITGFLGSTRLGLGGPDGARLTVLVLPVSADPAAPAKVWDWTTEDVAITAENNLDLTTVVTAREGESAVVPGCRQSIHIEGRSKVDWDYTVGITLCAVNASETILVTTSGEVLGRAGWAASDRVATLLATELANASIVPTHRYEPRGMFDSGLYQDASVGAQLVEPLTQGTLLRWTGDIASSPALDSKMLWLEMRTTEGIEGWIPGDSLIPIAEGWLPEGYFSATPEPE